MYYGDCFVRQSNLGARALVLSDYRNNKLYVAYKGTSSWNEIKVDLGQMFGFSVHANAYYKEASQLLGDIIRERANEKFDELIITGHSLGGALGVSSSLDLGINDGGYDFNTSIFTFNSAVLHMNNYFFRSFRGILEERDVENILNIVAIDDFVPLFKGFNSFTGLQGYTYALSAPSSFHNPLWNHGIEELVYRIENIKSERNFCDSFIGFSYLVPQNKT
ncbi:hypothetical protein ACS87_24000 [Vibrio parahaemolyticus]|uniref:lipase family protein n=1 Tax=Vibrio parahaemolyticus TaxID=670 RepID=UPI0006A5D8C6|nr:hypothetical protein [Vibrio parahaemolyticus]KOE73860.1 hypothetical protein ACS87_24000 [Vibrio parahaemolyticus]